jgi:sialate O-acetylesterase
MSVVCKRISVSGSRAQQNAPVGAWEAHLHLKGIPWCFVFAILMLFGTAFPANGEVKLPALISDNMVLHRGTKVPVWGMADPGEQVTVSLAGQTVSTTADSNGHWKIALGPFAAGGPWEMKVAGKNTLVLHNVVAGEVWVCSGQSNMEMTVGPHYHAGALLGGARNYEQEIAAANYPMIRYFHVKTAVAGRPQDDVQGQWVVTSPQTVQDFSAVGYFFGRELHKVLGVPVGLINASVGGTPAEAWTSDSVLHSDGELKTLLANWEKAAEDYPKLLNEFRQKLDRWTVSSKQAEAEGAPMPPQPTIPTDRRSSSWRPAGLYNAMIAPLTRYRIAGVIWYQGEAQAPFKVDLTGVRGYEDDNNRPRQYRKLFSALIGDWRKAWAQGDFPFLFVQLANYNQLVSRKDSWPEIREAQALALSLPKTAMAVAIDIGESNDVHPHNKQEVGRRLALAAEAVAYGRDVLYSGPNFRAMNVTGDAATLTFDHTDGGLVSKGGPLTSFEIAGEDHQFVSAQAEINGDTVVVRSPRVGHPAAVRYGWADDPKCNLYNGASLPAAPFRTDNWPLGSPDQRQ